MTDNEGRILLAKSRQMKGCHTLLGDVQRARFLAGEILWYGVPVLAVLLISFQFDFGAPLRDLFHEGEYLTAAASVQAAEVYGYPVLVHGLINFVPFQWASATCGPEAAFSCTRAINASLNALAMVAFLLCVNAVIAGRRDLRPIAGVVIAALLLLVNARAANQAQLHVGAPAIRDLFLLTEIACLLAASHSQIGRRLQLLLFVSAGALAGIGLFWSYNRGLIGLGLIVVHAGTFALIGRRPLVALAAFGALGATLTATYVLDPLSFTAHLRNIGYWLENGGMWKLERTLAAGKFFYLVAAGLLAYVSVIILASLKQRDAAISAVGLMLAALMVAFLQVASGRPDAIHFAFALPAMALLILFILRIRTPSWALTKNPGLLIASFVFIFFVDFISSTSFFDTSRTQLATNAKHILRGMPTNASLFGPRDRAVSSIIAALEPRCTYSLDNTGATYALAGRPACSRYAYPAYVPPSREGELIAELAQNRPQLIIWSSPHWSMQIDGRTARDRLPRLASWIQTNYPYEIPVGDVIIRSVRPIALPPAVLAEAEADDNAFDPTGALLEPVGTMPDGS